MAIPLYNNQLREQGLPGARVANSAGPEAFGAAVGRGVGQFGAALQAKVEEFEDAETLELVNSFQRDVNEFMLNPDKGLRTTRQGKNAYGAAEDADFFMGNKMAEYEGKLKSGRAVANFQRMAGKIRENNYADTMKWQAGQIDAYRDAEADARISMGLDGIAGNYSDDAAVESYREDIYQAMELKMRGMGDEARKAAAQAMEDKIGIRRLAPMLKESTAKAREWYEEHKDMFTAASRESIDDIIRQQENKEIGTELFEKYGFDQMAAINDIKASYDDPRQEAIITAYNQQVGQAYSWAQREEAARAKSQKQNMQNLISTYTVNGMPVPYDVLTNADIGYEGMMSILSLNADMADFSKVRTRVLSDPRYHHASDDVIDRETQKRMGINVAETQGFFRNMQAGIIAGAYGESDVAAAKERGWLLSSEAEDLKKLANKYSAEQSKYLKDQMDGLLKELNSLAGLGLSADANVAARDEFLRLTNDLDPADPQYRKSVFEAKQNSLLYAFEAHDGKMSKQMRERQGAYEMSRFNELDNSFVDWAYGLQPRPLPKTVTETAAASFVAGGGKITSVFGAGENFRDGSHKGLDIASAPGTPVLSPQLDGFVVSRIATGKARSKQKGDAGNYVWLEKDVNGHKVEIGYLHLGAVNVKKGQTVMGGQPLGGVGNTGYTVGKNGGYHLDVRVKIDGNYIDPLKLNAFFAANVDTAQPSLPGLQARPPISTPYINPDGFSPRNSAFSAQIEEGGGRSIYDTQPDIGEAVSGGVEGSGA